MKLIELFYSLQGEPQSIGKAAYFIRFPGCSLSCTFCDTKYASHPKQVLEREILSLIMDIKKYPTNLIVFTGGEPLLHKSDIVEIANYLSDYQFEIETNGTCIPFLFNELGLTNKVRYNCSPKLKSSGNPLVKRYRPEILRHFTESDILKNTIFKFVIKDMDDWLEMDSMVEYLKIPAEKVYVMPESTSYKKWRKSSLELIDTIKQRGYNLAPRLHIFLYGKKKGI